VGRSVLNKQNTEFVLLSFEGPDSYSMAGGLGVRVSNLAQALAHEGFHTHLFFIGDPYLSGEETTLAGRLRLHRWCQWISRYHPKGVYEGEHDKLDDFQKSIPPFVADRIVRDAVREDKLVVVLGEEWHTAETMRRLSQLLGASGLRDRVVMFWNANNVFGFDRIDWKRLSRETIITTVSRYMKHVMWKQGVNPLVIPNGIPRSLLEKVDGSACSSLSKYVNADLMLSKVARWDPDKRWNAAVEAIARLKARGIRTVLLARGGIEAHGQEVMYNARSLGLKVKEVMDGGDGLKANLESLGATDGADVLNIKFRCTPDLLRIVYHTSDAVLANSGHEPFGLVGLEAMAAGGMAFTGGTGEDYAIHLHNSVVLETADPREIEAYVMYLDDHPEERQRIRQMGRRTARRFTWQEITKNLLEKLTYQARVQGLLSAPPVRAGVSGFEPEFAETGASPALVGSR